MHSHNHNHPQSKKVINRLARLIGHMEAVKKMVEEGRDCSDVLTQLSAVISALNGVGKIILEDHIRNCVVDITSSGEREKLDKLLGAIDKYMGTHTKSTESWH